LDLRKRKWREPGEDRIMRSFITSTHYLIVRVTKVRRMRWVGHVARMREMRNIYNVLVRKPERKRPLGRHRRRQEDNIKMDPREIEWGVVDWMNLAQVRDQRRNLVNKVMKVRVS